MLGVDTARPAGDVEGTISGAPDAELEAIFARNIDTISAINRERGIRTVWVGQVMNPILGDRGSPWVPEATSPWVPLVPNKDLLALIARLNDILKRRAAALGDGYVEVDAGASRPTISSTTAASLRPAAPSSRSSLACRGDSLRQQPLS